MKRPIYNIPKPSTRAAEGDDFYQGRPRFPPPMSYIRFKKLSKQEATRYVTYDADEADEIFVSSHQDFGDEKRNNKLTIDRFERLIFTLENQEARRHAKGLKMITANDADTLFRSQFTFMNAAGSSKLAQDIVQYWVQKRNRIKKPLLRRYWPTTSVQDTNPHMVFRPRDDKGYRLRKHRKNDKESYVKMKRLQIHFRYANDLFKRVVKREKLKREALVYLKEAFHQAVHDAKRASAPAMPPRKLMVGSRRRGQLKLKFKLKLPPYPIVAKSPKFTAAHAAGDGKMNGKKNAVQRKRDRIQMLADAEAAAKEADALRLLNAQNGNDMPLKMSQKKRKRIMSPIVSTNSKMFEDLKLLGDQVELRRVSELRVRLDQHRAQLTVPHFLFPRASELDIFRAPLDSPPQYQDDVEVQEEEEETSDENDTVTYRQHAGARGLMIRGGPKRKRRRHALSSRFGYVCRTRVGRGGRYVIDRMRVRRRQGRGGGGDGETSWWHQRRRSRNRPDLSTPVAAHAFETIETMYARPPHRVELHTPMRSALPQAYDPPPLGSTHQEWTALVSGLVSHTAVVGATFTSPTSASDAPASTAEQLAMAGIRRREELDKIYEMSDSEEEIIVTQEFGVVERTLKPHERAKFVLRL